MKRSWEAWIPFYSQPEFDSYYIYKEGFEGGFEAALALIEEHAAKWQKIADDLRDETKPESYEFQSAVARELGAAVRKAREDG